MTLPLRGLPVLAVALAAVATTGGSASAGVSLGVVDVVDSGSSTGPAVHAHCSIDAAVLQPDGIQFLVSGNAYASNTNATPAPLATHVHCVVKTKPASVIYSWGGPSGDAAGPAAVAAGPSETVDLDKLGNLYVCAYASAFFTGGITRNSLRSPNC